MKLVFSLALLVASATVALPARAEDPPQNRRFPPSSVRSKVIATGVVFAGAGYGGALGAAYGWDYLPGSNELKIPVIGPWMALANSYCPDDHPDCDPALGARGFLAVVEGLMQIGGLALVAEGVFMTTEAMPKRTGLHRPIGAFALRPLPVVSPAFTGAILVGTF